MSLRESTGHAMRVERKHGVGVAQELSSPAGLVESVMDGA